VTKIANECGKAEVNKFETMFTDIEQARDLQNSNEFKDSAMVPIILTSWNWPNMGLNDTTAMPEELNAFAVRIDEVFKKKTAVNQSKKLQWILSEGSTTLELFPKMDKDKYTVEVKTHQACILLLFNKDKKLSYQ